MKWISVKDRLPPPYSDKWESILIYGIPLCDSCDKKWKVREGKYDKEEGFIFGEYDCGCNVTHWMPLPKPPEDK